MTFQEHPQAINRLSSANKLIKILLANREPELLQEHLQELIGILLWKITEIHGKYKTRYQSAGALECFDKKQLRHDHVYPRAKMVESLLRARENEVDDILKLAIGCTVTQQEHLLLSRFDREFELEMTGWERYQRAGVKVQDTQTGVWKT